MLSSRLRSAYFRVFVIVVFVIVIVVFVVVFGVVVVVGVVRPTVAQPRREDLRGRIRLPPGVRRSRPRPAGTRTNSSFSSVDDHIVLLRHRGFVRVDQILHSHHQTAFVILVSFIIWKKKTI